MECISQKTVKSRKEHKCFWCGQVIPSGTAYERTAIKDGIFFYVCKVHLHCRDITNDLDMFDDFGDEGLSQDGFQASIDQYIIDNHRDPITREVEEGWNGQDYETLVLKIQKELKEKKDGYK